ncbi:glutamine synthetase [Streptococcus mitis]|uniref:Glutamine synthetase n=1 Tax=Streptococcus mitis TaxID=28037 RepID=A0A6M9FF72_STRMT|nr:glutamine synthetase [Streptococcus mitis]QKL34026.1 glutamine synthetase [Streptococcus mitis]
MQNLHLFCSYSLVFFYTSDDKSNSQKSQEDFLKNK